MMPTTASPSSNGIHNRAAFGNKGMAKRRNPYVPILSSTPARAQGARGGGLDGGGGQPGVEREHRPLDRERYGEGEEEPGLPPERPRQPIPIEQIEAVHAGRRVMQEVRPQDGDQHEHRAR